MKVYIHLKVDHQSDQGFYTYVHEIPQSQLDNDYTISQFIRDVSACRSDLNPQYMYIQRSENAKPIRNTNMLLTSYFDNQDDVFIICDAPKPLLISNEERKIYYESIKNFSFYESGDWTVKVELSIPKIHLHDKNLISCRFFEQSFELKVHDFNGKNLQFSVPRTQYKLDPDKSKILIKDNQIVVCIRKEKKDDSWFSLFKVKCIGE